MKNTFRYWPLYPNHNGGDALIFYAIKIGLVSMEDLARDGPRCLDGCLFTLLEILKARGYTEGTTEEHN